MHSLTIKGVKCKSSCGNKLHVACNAPSCPVDVDNEKDLNADCVFHDK